MRNIAAILAECENEIDDLTHDLLAANDLVKKLQTERDRYKAALEEIVTIRDSRGASGRIVDIAFAAVYPAKAVTA